MSENAEIIDEIARRLSSGCRGACNDCSGTRDYTPENLRGFALKVALLQDGEQLSITNEPPICCTLQQIAQSPAIKKIKNRYKK